MLVRSPLGRGQARLGEARSKVKVPVAMVPVTLCGRRGIAAVLREEEGQPSHQATRHREEQVKDGDTRCSGS
jgi:hypothetical protein